ncbi:MAG: Grx4 family monothiol glutaredoxin [Myxococcota bacterium]
MSLDDTTQQKIDDLVHSHHVMLFMKGNRQAPQCGFSATVIQILDSLTPEYETADVLSDAALRDGIKTYSAWPTIPQLYVEGEFIGGCDIIQELFDSGELHEKLGIQLDLSIRPTITISDEAAEALRKATPGAGAGGEDEERELHLTIDSRYQASLAMAPRRGHDIEIDANGIRLLIDALSAQRAEGLSIETVDTPNGAGFKIENPNAPEEA